MGLGQKSQGNLKNVFKLMGIKGRNKNHKYKKKSVTWKLR